METTATAVIKCHDSSSPWSPRPPPQPNPPLFEIMASHWGPVSSHEMMQRIIAGSRSPPPLPRRAVRIPPPLGLPTLPSALSTSEMARGETVRRTQTPAPTRAAPPIPRRQTSLQHASVPLHDRQNPETPGSSAIEEYDSESDPARKIWTEMRRTFASADDGGRPSYRVSGVRKVPSSAARAPPKSSGATREVAVAVRRLSPDRKSLESVTPPSKKGSTAAAAIGSVGRPGSSESTGRRQEVRSRRSVGSDLRGQMLRKMASTSAVDSNGEQRGEERAMRLDGMTGNGKMKTGNDGAAVGLGGGAGNWWMANADGVEKARTKEKEKDAGRWTWAGWWQ